MSHTKAKKGKYIAAAAVLLLLALIVTLLSLRWLATVELADFRKSSTVVYALGDAADDLSTYETVEDGMMGGQCYMRQDGTSFLTVSSFPDALWGSARVVEFRLCEGSEAEFHIIGVRVTDSAEAAYRALETHGYEVTHSSSGGIRAQRGRITLQFDLSERGKVTEIRARLSGTNFFGVQY